MHTIAIYANNSLSKQSSVLFRNANRWHPNYPTGRSRLETIAVLACAMIMSCATVLVIRECIGVLVDGLAHGECWWMDLHMVSAGGWTRTWRVLVDGLAHGEF
jgi:hypothetical protein